MGYTHYWEYNKINLTESELITLRGNLEEVINRYKDIIQYEDDVEQSPELYIDWENNIVYIRFNGINESGHETFFINKKNNTFCKTARKPYDQAVCECLLIYHHYGLLKIDSDGFSNYSNTIYEKNQIINDEDIDGTWSESLENINQQLLTNYHFACKTYDKKTKNFNYNLKA